jgi:hypothetical protein
MGLQSFFKIEKELQWKSLWQSAAIGIGTLGILFILKGMFTFVGANDEYYIQQYGEMGQPFIDALRDDRRTMFFADLLRSGFLMAIVAGILWLVIKNKLAQNTAIILIGVIMVGDLFFIDKNYLDGKSFVSRSEVEVPFQETPSDAKILQDTTQYRVFEVSGNLSSARASFFYKSIGGYSAVKPRRMQQLFDYQIAKNNMEILNMLNVKYLIQTNEKGEEFPVQNPDANGNAWFVKELKTVNSADAEMKALGKLDSKNVAVLNTSEFGTMTKNDEDSQFFQKDSLATINLDSYKPNHLKYTSNNTKNGLAVFSEMYYANGWNAYIDGKKGSHIRVDYVLRGLQIPAGKHTIEFKFEPEVVKTGSTITLISSIGMLLLLIGGIYFENKKSLNLKS